MLFGAQYEDESGPSPTQPRKKKTGSSRRATGATGKAPPGSTTRRTEKRTAVGPPATAAFSPSSQSTSSSSLNSLASSFTNESTSTSQYNYNTYNLGQLGRFTYNGDGVEAAPIGGRLSAGNTPVKAAATPKRRITEPAKRYAKLFGVLNELAPAPMPHDTSVLYPSVWKALRFRKKMIQLASSRSVKPICVTGVDGFLGAWIVCELLERGYRVRGTVQSRKDDVSGILALPASKTNFTVVETSLLTPEACDTAVQGTHSPCRSFYAFNRQN